MIFAEKTNIHFRSFQKSKFILSKILWCANNNDGLLMDKILKQKATHHHHITIIFSQLYQAKQSKSISPSSRVTSTVLFSSPEAPTVSLNYSLSFHWLPGWLTLFFHSSWAENIYCNEWVKVPSAVLVANSKQPVLWCLTERTGLTSQLFFT